MFEKRAILAFHQTSDRFYPGINNIRQNNIFSIFKLLLSWGYKFIPLQEKHFGTDEGKPEALMTFDDGYAENFGVLSRLITLGTRPMVFIPTDYIGRKNSWDYSSKFFGARHLNQVQIRELSDKGVMIGSHGASHRCLTIMDNKKVGNELSRSRKVLEDITGEKVGSLSFPFGRTNDRVNRIAAECGYDRCYTLGTSSFTHESGRFVQPRIPIYGNDDYYSLKAKLSTGGSGMESLKMRVINRLAGGTIIVSPGLK